MPSLNSSSPVPDQATLETILISRLILIIGLMKTESGMNTNLILKELNYTSLMPYSMQVYSALLDYMLSELSED
jgi:hypothetical protein